jgi:hypothetical protein
VIVVVTMVNAADAHAELLGFVSASPTHGTDKVSPHKAQKLLMNHYSLAPDGFLTKLYSVPMRNRANPMVRVARGSYASAERPFR